MLTRLALSLALAGTLPLCPVRAGANPGDLDPTFGAGGKVITDFGASEDAATALAVQADGKLVAAGYTGSGPNADFALVRYNLDGSLDPSFGTDGKVTTDFGAISDEAFALAVQPDGKLVAAGFANHTDTAGDFALARYNPDGSLDSSFGTGGKVTTDFGASQDIATALVVQADGKLVAAGYTDNGSNGVNYDFALVRYNADGSLDPAFGAGGKVTTDIGANDFADALAVQQADGKLVAAGTAIVRYNADGSFDASFGMGVGRATALAVQADGRLVAAGYDNSGSNADFALARYNADGSFDASFGTGGTVSTDLGADIDGALALAVQMDGKVVAAGFTGVLGNGAFALVRYNADGSLDPTFGTDGKVTTDFGGLSYATALIVQTDGKLVAAGTDNIGTGSDYDFALVRYLVALTTTTTSTTTTSTSNTTSTVTTTSTLLPAQIVLGKSFVVKDPAPGVAPSFRSIVVLGKEPASTDTVVGDPLANGATVEIIANGAAPTVQVFTMPAGAPVNSSAGWSPLGNPVIGYSYRDARGVNGPVKAALIKKASNRTFLVKVTLKGAVGPGPQPHITVVPPAPGTDGGLRFVINGGDTYCVGFGGAAGGAVTNAPSGIFNKVFKVASKSTVPTTEAGCPSPQTTTTTSTSSTTLCVATSGTFCDLGNGAIFDSATGLQWEQKDGADGRPGVGTPNPGDLHDVDNLYSWAGNCTITYVLCQPDAAAAATCAAQSSGGTLGCGECGVGDGTCNVSLYGTITTIWGWLNQVNAAGFAGHGDWRLPSENGRNTGSLPRELESLRDPTQGGCGGTSGACIDAIFSPTVEGTYWSATTYTTNPTNAWYVWFGVGSANPSYKSNEGFVRAVRAGP